MRQYIPLLMVVGIVPVVGTSCTHVAARYAMVDYDFELVDESAEDEIEASLYRVRLEKSEREKDDELLGGIEVSFLREDEELQARPERARLRSYELFPYFLFPIEGGDFRASTRFGLSWRQLEYDPAGPSIEWSSLGLKLLFEPDVCLLRSRERDESLSVYGELGGTVSAAGAEVAGDLSKFEALAVDYQAELGLRYRIGALEVRAGWFHGGTRIDDIDDDKFALSKLETRMSGVAFYVGLHF